MSFRYRKPEVLADVPDTGDVVIEASAGTGKTYTLERLIIDLILGDGTPDSLVSVEEILVVTFTDRATRELKSRVRGLLEDIVTTTQSCPADVPHWVISEEARIWLERQLFSFDRAPIHTIHGWCHRVLTENAFFIGKLLDQEHVDAQRIFDAAFVTALREHFATDPNLTPFLTSWLELHSVDNLRRDLSNLLRVEAIVRPVFHAERVLQAIRSMADFDPKSLVDAYRTVKTGPPYERDECAALVGRMVDAAAHVKTVAELPGLLAFLGEDDINWFNLEARSGDLLNADGALGALKLVMGQLTALRPAALQQFLPTMKTVLDDHKAKGFFDYDDMLQAVWDKLDDGTPSSKGLLKHLRGRYKHALIDEFQDTDAVQWAIFRRIFHESRYHRLFVIGDPKQAIYAFRGADVHTYLDARRTISPPHGKPHVILKENFRSTQNLINAYNAVFDQSVEEPLFTGDIGYEEPVVCGRPDAYEAEWTSGERDAPMVLVRMVPDGDRIWASDLKRRHGQFIATEIQRLVGHDPLLVDDGEQMRPIRPRDIFILTHTKTEERLIGEHLKAAHVPFAFYKQEGLFQTPEALDVLDLLVAISDPYLASNRLRVWATPFFAVEFDRLHACVDLPETHPLFEALVRWHETAIAGRFDQLFNDILEHSGLIRREIFLKANERELTNYQHIFEVLTEEVHSRGLDIRELILRLRAFHDETRIEESDEKNIQRLETEKDAVQVMTMHKSKGLEAEVVFVYGGWTKPPVQSFNTCHWNGRRILYIGMPHLEVAQKAVDKDAMEEAQRLLYVAATRAKSKLYLPVIGSTGTQPEFQHLAGVYRALNPRLWALAKEGHDHIRCHEVSVDAIDPDHVPVATIAPRIALPNELLTAEVERRDVERFRPIRRVISSYSRMKAATGGYKGPADDDEDALALELAFDAPAMEEDRLPGGTATGLFLHDIMEHINFSTSDQPFETWVKTNAEIIQQMMERHNIDQQWRQLIDTMIFKTCSQPVRLPHGDTMPNLGAMANHLAELEFMFPIPEANHPDLQHLGQVEIKRGFIKGYIDLLFEYDGRIYFADWKSDTLDDYEDQALGEHVAKNYQTQAMLYSLATIAHFGIVTPEAYEARFGGYLYVFMRGTEASNHGIFADRPSYEALQAYRESLFEFPF